MVSPHLKRLGMSVCTVLAAVSLTTGCSSKDDTGADESSSSAGDGADSGGDSADSGGDSADSGGDSADSGDSGSADGGTSGGDDSTGDGGSATMTGGFIDPPDGGVVGQCDPGLQDCPNEDEKCTSYASTPGSCCTDATKCVPIEGMQQEGDTCTRNPDNDDCDKGLFCTTQTSGSTGMGVCEQFCVPNTPDACDNGGTCIPYNDGVHPLCRVSCDPLLQDCDQNLGCYPGSDNFVCGPPANNPGEGQDGSECYTGRSCERGLACMADTVSTGCPAGGRCCTPFCDLSMGTTGNPTCTETGEECIPWYEMGMEPPEYMNVGVCGIPV